MKVRDLIDSFASPPQLHLWKKKGPPPDTAQREELRVLVLSLASKSPEERVQSIGGELVQLLG